MVKDEFDKIKGAVMIVYPMGLPPYDEVQHILNDTEDLSGREDGKAVIAPDEGQLWWAGKELSRSKKLSDYIGKNEKVSSVASAAVGCFTLTLTCRMFRSQSGMQHAFRSRAFSFAHVIVPSLINDTHLSSL
jgi:hypothetical protein